MNDRYIVEREFEHAGYQCVVIFQDMGHRCGYVGITKSNILYGKSYCDSFDMFQVNLDNMSTPEIFRLLGESVRYASENIPMETHFICHGGITYSGGGEDSDYPIASDLWWFGFDCAHAGDKRDLKLAYDRFSNKREILKYQMELEEKYPIEDDVIRTEEYVADECRKLAEQLKAFEEVRK